MSKIKQSSSENSHFINGTWLPGQGAEFVSTSPTDSSVVWEGKAATESEVVQAMMAAQNAFGNWASLKPAERIKYIQQFGQHVKKNKEAFSLLIAKETGKPLWESLTEVNSVIGKIDISIQAYHERTGSKELPTADATGHLRFKPHGVVAVLGPFNFPAHLCNGHIVPALIAGNTVILKPSELTPAVAEFMVQLWSDANLPDGVLNCVQGDAATAQTLIQQNVKGVYFTGSYQTGLAINKQLSHRPEVILALEMGGNNPLLIDEVSDLQAALYTSVLSSFITAGQRCTCARRLLVADNASGDAFLEQFIHLSQTIQVGPYNQNPEPFMGPVISHHHAVKYLEAQAALLALGGTPLLKMASLQEDTGFLSPGIIDMTNASADQDQEIFAPLVQVYRYKEFEQALELANQTQYGLAAGILTDNEAHYKRFYKAVQAGLINWNRPTTGAASNLPFGGIKHSGNHRPSASFAADYCAYPVSSLEQPILSLPTKTLPGIKLT